MFYQIDSVNRRELVTDYPVECWGCEHRLDECSDTSCKHYKAYSQGYSVVHEGPIGSGFVSLLSIDTKALADITMQACIPYIDQQQDFVVSFSEWLKHCYILRPQLGDAWQLFLHTKFLHNQYTQFVWAPTMDSQIWTPEQQKDILHRRLEMEIGQFECLKYYAQAAVKDMTYYDIDKFRLADKELLRNNVEIDDLHLDMVEVNFYPSYTEQFKALGIDIFRYAPKDFTVLLDAMYSRAKRKKPLLQTGFTKIYEPEALSDFARASIFEIISAGHKFKQCANCGTPFIAYKRSDTRYCDRVAPQDTAKTCKEYGAQESYKTTLQTDEATRLYRNIYMAKQMLAKRNPDIEEYRIAFESYKNDAKEWKRQVKDGKKSRVEYLKWLQNVRAKKV